MELETLRTELEQRIDALSEQIMQVHMVGFPTMRGCEFFRMAESIYGLNSALNEQHATLLQLIRSHAQRAETLKEEQRERIRAKEEYHRQLDQFHDVDERLEEWEWERYSRRFDD